MNNTVVTVLIFLPVILAAVASLALWSKLERPFLFAVASALALTGIQSLIAPAAVSVLLPGGGGLTLEAARGAFGESVIASALLVLIAGIPFLWWLQRGLRKNGEAPAA